MRVKSIAAIALFALQATTVSAQDLGDLDREAFRAEVRAYLLENPEVIMEAIAVLQAREEQAAQMADANLVAAHAEALFDDPTSFVGGNPDGDITIVEFLDYRCGYCKRAHPEVAELLSRDGNIRYIIKEYPVLGEASDVASRYALAVRAVEGDAAYLAVHDTMMTMQGNSITVQNLDRLSSELGFDVDAVKAAMNSSETSDILTQNRNLGRAMGINGTPTFVVESQLLRGYLPLDRMIELVAAQRG